MGLANVELDEFGLCLATLPDGCDKENIANLFCSHVVSA
jgi:hypothetical protein